MLPAHIAARILVEPSGCWRWLGVAGCDLVEQRDAEGFLNQIEAVWRDDVYAALDAREAKR